MRGLLALDDAVELVTVTLLPLINARPARDKSLAQLLDDLVTVHPSLGSHAGPMAHLRRLRDRVKHEGVIPSSEELRLNTVQAESFIRAAVPAVTGLTLEQTSPADSILDEELKGYVLAAGNDLENGDFVNVCINASKAFALGRRRFEVRTARETAQRDIADQIADQLVHFLSRVAWRAAGRTGSTEGRQAAEALSRTFENERGLAGDLARTLSHAPRLAQIGVDLEEHERFIRLTPHVTVQSEGDWCQVVMMRDLTPGKLDAYFVLDFVTRALLEFQERATRMASEGVVD